MVEFGKNPEGMASGISFKNSGGAVEILIQKESSECMKCNKAFAHEQRHHSLLKIEGNTFLREDYCEKCWGNRSELMEDTRVYSYWETKYRDPAAEKTIPKEQFIPLLNLCYESIAKDGQEAEAMAYMCALILRRQKIFKFIREDRDNSTGKTMLVFLDKHNDTQIRITDPHLTDSELKDVKQRLEDSLGDGRGQANEE